MKKILEGLKNSTATIISAAIIAFATIVAGYFSIQASLAPKRLEIATTQTAEAKQTELALVLPTTSTLPEGITETPPPTNTPTLTLIPAAQTSTNNPSLIETLTPVCIYSTDNGTGGNVTIPVSPPQKVSQIIIFMLKKISNDPTWGYSLFEVQAYGVDPADNLVSGGKAEASSTQQEFFAEKVIDGNQKDPSRWSSEPGDSNPQKLTITLNNPPQLINSIVLYWERAYAVTYKVCISP